MDSRKFKDLVDALKEFIKIYKLPPDEMYTLDENDFELLRELIKDLKIKKEYLNLCNKFLKEKRVPPMRVFTKCVD